MIKKILSTLILLCVAVASFSTNTNNKSDKKDSTGIAEIPLIEDTILSDDPSVRALDMLMQKAYFEQLDLTFDSALLNTYNFPKDSIPIYSDEEITSRLYMLDQNTPFNIVYNTRVKAFINLYANKKKELTEKVMGLSHLYFPMFEEILDKYNLPLEFKYLAVVESALNPTARSRAGATGLWQFMYTTGIIYDLKVSSYEDDRMDPIKATEAACAYFKRLYSIYHDWDLVLAAYNCGPGNVNKAIRRSGRRGYWDIYRYLPRETRGYVPAFIAVNYVMNYAAEHNLYPTEPDITYFQYDTVMVKNRLNLEQVAGALEIPIKQLQTLNPIYKKNIIPFDGNHHVLRLPVDKIGAFVVNEVEIYAWDKPLLKKDSQGNQYVMEEMEIVHVVRSGEYLGKISEKYGVGLSTLKEWNHLRSSNIYPGQRLRIYKMQKIVVKRADGTKVNQSQASLDSQKAVSKQTPKSNPKQEITSANKVFYSIQKGDTLWDIAKAKGISVSQLERLNSHLNFKRLKPGDKIIIGSKG